MLIVIISVFTLAFGIVCLVLNENSDKFKSKSVRVFLYKASDTIMTIGLIFTIFGAIANIFCFGFLIGNNINPELQYRKDEITYEILQEQVDNGDYNSTTLTSNIIEYNQKVTEYKDRYDSPWVGWFYYKDCEKLPFVEIRETQNDAR